MSCRAALCPSGDGGAEENDMARVYCDDSVRSPQEPSGNAALPRGTEMATRTTAWPPFQAEE